MSSRPGTHLCSWPCRLIPAALLILIFTGFVGSLCAHAAEDSAPLSTHLLVPGLKAEIQTDGSLVFWANGSSEPVLTARVPDLNNARRSRGREASANISRFNLTEGIEGGQRGFSSRADDDGDGEVDEDWLDGVDNDGDGLVDEDFAAIGDDMTVVHRQMGTSWVHQESYHWSYPILRPAVFLSLATNRNGLVALEVQTANGAWIESDISTLHHSTTGKPTTHLNHPFVTRLDDLENGPLWLAVMVLGDRPGYLAMGNDLGNQLDFPLSEEPLPLVVCAARSWLQLTTMLTESNLLYQGVSDPVNQHSAGWIVPASCSMCRTSSLPSFTWRQEGERSLILRAQVTLGQSALLDPDLFLLAGRRLGSPVSITWIPTEGSGWTMDWMEITPAGLRTQGGLPIVPYANVEALMGHTAEGTLEFRFNDLDLFQFSTSDNLKGRWLTGRSFLTEVMAPGKPEVTAVPVPETPVESLTESSANETATLPLGRDRIPPTLSPELLDGWPNPFRDVIQIKFKVPETVGEAFVWVDEKSVPKGLDLEAAVPWQGGSPSASIKIYNINGQELMTLHDGTVIQGEFTVNWNGTDIFGRQVASGTYFCKLQLDDWSVTRRIVYLR